MCVARNLKINLFSVSIQQSLKTFEMLLEYEEFKQLTPELNNKKGAKSTDSVIQLSGK